MKPIGGRLLLSATDLSAHAACEHLTQLRLREHLDEGEREPRFEGAGTRALRERGLRHEREYLDHLRASGRNILDLGFAEGDPRPSYEKIGEAIARTREAVSAHVDVIAQARFQSEMWGGSADVLLWDAENQRYDVVDTKLSRQTKGGTILQLLVYAELLDELARQRTERVGVVAPGRSFEVEWHRVKEYGAYFRLVKRRLIAAIETRPTTYGEPVEHCTVCNWWQRCETQRRADDHLSLIAGISRGQRREAIEQGLPTLESFAESDDALWPPRHGVRQALERVHRQARIQLKGRREGKPIHELLPRDPAAKPPLGLGMLPEPDAGDIFFDIEGDRFAGEAGLEYLFGTVDMNGAFTPRWARTPKAERKMLEDFIDFLVARFTAHPNAHVYHFGHYEVSALKRLAQRYGTREHELDSLLRTRRFVDLLRVVKTSLIASVEGYSIKLLEPLYDFVRTEDLERSRAYRRLLEIDLEQGAVDEAPDEMLTSIANYNREDCESTRLLRDWLESLRSDLVRSGEDIPRPGIPEPEDEQPRPPELQHLLDRLLDGVPEDVAERDTHQQARATLAALTEYHYRERRNAWWEFFAAFETEEDDLETPNTIGQLTFIDELVLGPRQKNPRLRFAFPEQRIDAMGDQAYWAMDFENGVLGSIEDIDRDSGILTVSVKPERVGLRPSFVVIAPANIQQNLAKAIRTFAAAVAERGFDDAGFPATTDLLLRRPPRIADRQRGEPLQSDADDIVADACLLAESLEAGVLAIQGPPGTGKTFTGARLIARLVEQGKRVGVCALSHAAIDAVLDAVREHAPSVRMAHVDAQFRMQAAIAGLASGDLHIVGATSFQWCKDDARGTIDVLVIDEAGQLPLADALAASMAAPRLILLGDPQQLQAPQQGTHPEGAGTAALAHLLGGRETIPPDLGLFLTHTRRLAEPLARFTSEVFYEGRLSPADADVRDQAIVGTSRFAGAGLHVIPVSHSGNQSVAIEEVEEVARLLEHLTTGDLSWRCGAKTASIKLKDVLIVAPYNAQVGALRARIPGARVGTVDRFQGQEAPIVILSTATSTPDDAPRGMEFLYSRHRLNVATSRARCAAILVCNTVLLEPECRSPKQMRLANGYAAFVEAAEV